MRIDATQSKESVRSEGEPLSENCAGLASNQLREVDSATLTKMQKNDCASVACALDIHQGRKKSTVRPPSTPCAITVPSAVTPSHFIQRRSSERHTHAASPMVNRPTNSASMR